MFMHISLYLYDAIIPKELTKQADFVAQSFIGFSTIIRVFRGFDGLSSISGSKIMAKMHEGKSRDF